MEKEQEYKRYATSYTLNAADLYYGFAKKKYIDTKRLPETESSFAQMCGGVLRYLFYLVIEDIIDNKITFKLPPGTGAWIEMGVVSGDDFVTARQKGAFEDVDYLASNFTGYHLLLRFNTKFGHWKKRIYVSRRHKDRIIEKTNKGETW